MKTNFHTSPLSIDKKYGEKKDFYPTTWQSNDTATMDQEIAKWEIYSLDGKLVRSGNTGELKVIEQSGFYLLKTHTSDLKRNSFRIKIE